MVIEMNNRNRYRDPFSKNPMERTNPFDMGPMRPVRRPAPRRQPQSDMGDAVKGVTDVAKIAVISGATIGILGAFQK